MKKLIIFTLCALMLLSSLTLFAAADGDILTGKCGADVYYEYNKQTKTLVIKGSGKMDEFEKINSWTTKWPQWFYDCRGAETVIIEDGVTSICDKAFQEHTSLEKLIIGNTVESIGMDSFRGCTALKEIIIPDSVKTVGSSAFDMCTSAEKLVIGDGVTDIGDCAFSICSSVTDLKIGSSVEKIGSRALSNIKIEELTLPDSVRYLSNEVFAFSDLKKLNIGKELRNFSSETVRASEFLTEINIDPDNPYLKAEDGVVFDKSGRCLYACLQTKSGYYGVPAGVKYINPMAFCGCSELQVITLPKGLEFIGSGAFYGCSSLTDIEIPYGVKHIKEGTFRDCGKIEYISIPSSVISIDRLAFDNCKALKTVYYSGSEEDWNNMDILYTWSYYYDSYPGEGYDIYPKQTNVAIIDADKVFGDIDPTVPVPDFTDSNPGDWHYEAVAYCYRFGYMSGVSETTFAPDSALTREMFVTILAKICRGCTYTYFDPVPFTDVVSGSWYEKPVAWSVTNGYTSGLSETVFGTGMPVTREQIAVFLYNHAVKSNYKLCDPADISGYTDAGSVSDWAKDAVRWAVACGIISGTGENVLSPKSGATRAQVAVMISKYVSTVMDKNIKLNSSVLY